MYSDDNYVFNDITEGNNWQTEIMSCPMRNDSGSNYGYKASKGYDPVYGLGTPNVGLMINWIQNHI